MLATRTCWRLEVTPREADSPRLLEAARQSGFEALESIREVRLYFLQGALDRPQVEQLCRELLVDPVTEILALEGDSPPCPYVEVCYLPGVTDAAAEDLASAARRLGLPVERAATGTRYLLEGRVDGEALARKVLSNPLVQRHAVNRPVDPPFAATAPAPPRVEVVPVRRATPRDLERLSSRRRLALDVEEMRAVQGYFRREGRDPTGAELETLAQTWSEHCAHKTFRATIDYYGPPPGPAGAPPRLQRIPGLLNLLRRATKRAARKWVRSAFVDNAGIVEFDEAYDLAFKVETHNHPSALEPFGGASTGVGGVVRDILGVSARPIATTDVLCFGPPELPLDSLPPGVLPPRRIRDGVIHGIEDYANKMGIPTVSGAILYHPGYAGNPLVYCGCVGLLPRGSHPRRPRAGDRVVLLGGRTGRDGLRGATFSSMVMDRATGEVAGSAVQIGHPIEEKNLSEVLLRARDEGLYHAVTDCGAGGLSSAVGEMGAELGVEVDLEEVPLKYPGLQPWEIWLSEAQERMVLAVPDESWERLQALAREFGVEAVSIGRFQATGRLSVRYGATPVVDLAMEFLHRGRPPRRMQARWLPPPEPPEPDAHLDLLQALAHPSVASKEEVLRRYDHEVQGGTALRPLVGVGGHGPGDAAVLVPMEGGGRAGVALSVGVCPGYGERDPYRMAWAAVDEAFRNAVAVGADPDRVALLDNFSWGDPSRPDRLGSLVRCVQGCCDAAVAYRAPFISGKDSLNNEWEGQPVPGTLVISALARVPDVRSTVSMDLKEAGNLLYLVGETRDERGGSLWAEQAGWRGGTPPGPYPRPLERLRALHRALAGGGVRACHDLSEGGLAVALAEMCLAGRLGARLDLQRVPGELLCDEALLYSESLGRFLVEVRPEGAPAFEEAMAGWPCARVGEVLVRPRLEVVRGTRSVGSWDVEELERAFRGSPPERATVAPVASRPPDRSPGVPLLKRPPRVLVMHAPGTNRDREAARACALAGGEPEIVTVARLASGEVRLADYAMLVLPGGFSYGDHLGPGRLWALDLRLRLGEELRRFAEQGRPVLGICNGFQALVQARLLGEGVASLAPNRSRRFECRWVVLEPNPQSPCLFTRDLEEPLFCPVAHSEGRLVVKPGEELPAARVALTYAGEGYPANPNGSHLGIAGLTNRSGNVLGLMPHPEDHLFDWHHPRYHRGEWGGKGLALFVRGLRHAR